MSLGFLASSPRGIRVCSYYFYIIEESRMIDFTRGRPVLLRPWPLTRWWVNQPGDTLCYVSPARCAFSSFTCAKRITRLILPALGYAAGESQKLLALYMARVDVRRLLQKF